MPGCEFSKWAGPPEKITIVVKFIHATSHLYKNIAYRRTGIFFFIKGERTLNIWRPKDPLTFIEGIFKLLKRFREDEGRFVFLHQFIQVYSWQQICGNWERNRLNRIPAQDETMTWLKFYIVISIVLFEKASLQHHWHSKTATPLSRFAVTTVVLISSQNHLFILRGMVVLKITNLNYHIAKSEMNWCSIKKHIDNI